MPERPRRCISATTQLITAGIERVLAVRVAFCTVLSILRCDEADLDDASEAGRHERVPEDSVHLRTDSENGSSCKY